MKKGPVKGYVHSFLQSIKVFDCGDLTKIRIGNPHDGGYVLYREICEHTKNVYSIGVGDDAGFEQDWINRFPKSRIEFYDPFIDEVPIQHKQFALHKFGLGLKYKPLTGVKSDSLLKMDIEWDEWGAFEVFEKEEIMKFSQILVELHIFHVEPPNNLSPYFYQKYDEMASRINEGVFAKYYGVMQWLANWFIIYHIHANNSLQPTSIDGYWFPPLLELSFIRRDLISKCMKTKSTFPIEGLDSPNKTNRPDIFDYYPFV